MLRAAKCSFCNATIEPGTGIMYVKRDGTVFFFCSGKCRKNMLKLRRKPAKIKWAKKTREEAQARRR
ncbi:MAG: 50S ribosomal protein L24e [Thermoprotei archaeon]|nr:MAG: 50S ribosomal protein L24e [Thermoprotei archaeon]